MTPEESKNLFEIQKLEKENAQKYFNFRSSFKASKDGVLYKKICIEGKEYVAFKKQNSETFEILNFIGPIGKCIK